MPDLVDVVVVGGGQAGLATSHELTAAGVDHVVLERDRVAESWRRRWDSFTLVLPNWSILLPGHPYRGDEPEGFMARDRIVEHLEHYAASIPAPVREGVEVRGLRATPTGWLVETSDGILETRAVVVATGSFRRVFQPPGWDSLPAAVLALEVSGYRNPASLPEGPVLVLGSGQSGCQIAEELNAAGREVVLSCGRSPWLPRRIGDHDMFWWAIESGFMDVPATALPDQGQRLSANPQVTGRDGGRDLNLRTLLAAGVRLAGRFEGVEDGTAHFGADLHDSVAAGDQVYLQLRDLFQKLARERDMPEPDMPDPPLWDGEGITTLDLTDVGAVLLTSGYRPDYTWMELPETLDPMGFPVQHADGTGPLPGVHFMGSHFLRTRKSALLPGVGEDAAVIARAVEEHLAR